MKKEEVVHAGKAPMFNWDKLYGSLCECSRCRSASITEAIKDVQSPTPSNFATIRLGAIIHVFLPGNSPEDPYVFKEPQEFEGKLLGQLDGMAWVLKSNGEIAEVPLKYCSLQEKDINFNIAARQERDV